MQTIQRVLSRPPALGATDRVRRTSSGKSADREPGNALKPPQNGGQGLRRLALIVLMLIQAIACSAGDTYEGETTASDGIQLVGKTADIVLDLAESNTGWSGSTAVSLSSDRKQGGSSLSSTGTGQDRFRRNNLPAVDVRTMKYLTFWYYVSDVSKIRTDRDAQIEISSHASIDTEEVHWNVHGQKLRSGWNFVRLLLPTTASNVLAAVKRFRIYHFVSASVTTRIDDIRFSNREPLEFATGCANAAANRTLTGGGKFNQASGSSATGCSGSYVVDLNDYAKTHTYGTSIAYGDTMPTTKAACENTFLRVGVWECLPGSTTSSCAPSVAGSSRAFLGEVVARGVWLLDPANQGICRRPLITLERHIPEFEANGVRDFKIAMRAETTGATQRALSFATTARLESNIYAWDQLRNEINALSAGAIHPSLHKVWLKKGTAAGDLLCRSSQLDLTLMTFSARSLTQLGATSANVTAKNNAYAAMRSALCTTSGTEAALQSATRDFLSALINIRTGLADQHFATASSLGGVFGDFQQYSVMLMAESMRHSLGLLLSNCNPSVSDLFRYENTGALPTGIAADRMLLGSCGNNSASNAALALGVGGTLTSASARTTLADCLAPSGQDICKSPYASGTQSGGGDASNPNGCFSGGGASVPCTTSQTQDNNRRRGVLILADENGKALTEQDIERYRLENPGALVVEIKVHAEQQSASRIELDKPFPEDTVGGRLSNEIIRDIDDQLKKLTPIYRTTKQVLEELVNEYIFGGGGGAPIDPLNAPGCELNGTCHPAAWPCPGAPGETGRSCPPDDGSGGGSGTDDTCLQEPCAWQGEQYCPPEWVQGGWYGASNSQYSDGRIPRQITQQDRIEHCFCQATDPGYAATGTPSVRASAMCPEKREQVAHYCLAAQWGPNDPVPPECLGELQPAHVDNGEWMTRICDKIRCPENQYSVPSGDRCECISLTTDVLGDPLGELCRRKGWAAHCEEGTDCVCGGEGYGDFPFNDPTCLNDPSTFPGSLERFSSPTPERLLVFADPRTPDDLFVGLHDDSATLSRVVSAVLPSLEQNTLPVIGTGVSTRLVTTEAASSGVFQLYLHNPENGVFHEFADQCELRTLTPGQPALCDLTPDNSQRRTKWNDCLRSGGCSFEMTLQGTPAGYDGILGFTAPVFNGTLRTATGPLPPACPRPAPDIFVRDLNSLWEDLGGTPDAPSVDITLGSGTDLEIPSTTFTINPGLIKFVNPG